MKLEWPSKISHVTVLNLTTGTSWWIFVTSCQIMEWYWTWYFYIFNDTLSLIRSEPSSIKFDCERLSTNQPHNLDWLKIVYLSHSFYFSKSNVIVDLVGMALVFMNCYSSFFFVWNKFYYKLLCLLTITVEDEMLRSEVHESITCNTQSFWKNESNFICSAKLIHSEEMLNALKILRVTYHIVSQVILQRERIQCSYLNIRI